MEVGIEQRRVTCVTCLQLSRISKSLFALEKGMETNKGQNFNTLGFSLSEDEEGVSDCTATIKKKMRMEPCDADADDGRTCTRFKRKLTEDPGFDSPKKRGTKEVDDDDDDDRELREMEEGDNVSSATTTTSMQKKKSGLMAKRKCSQPRRREWSEEEQAAVFKHLAEFVERHQVPGKADCVKCTENESALKHRTWKDVKYFIYNRIRSLSRTNL